MYEPDDGPASTQPVIDIDLSIILAEFFAVVHD